MKKSYLLIAAAGLIMAACSQEDDFVAQNQAAAGQNDGAVMFDTYLSNNTTRAGQTGPMTTSSLQKTGFGVIAFTHSVATSTGTWANVGGMPTTSPAYTPTATPNFMWNQLVGYEASNWTYSPLKYWPNEAGTTTDTGAGNDATATDEEGVSFFAYAPYVTETSTAEAADGIGADFVKAETTTSGIVAISKNAKKGDPFIHYIMASNSKASESVDLLWGTSTGFSYHPVNATTVVTTEAGKPVLNMVKPGIEEKIKFNFQHALARIGMKVVGAFDQVAQGGTLDQFTRVRINEVTVSGKFAKEGYLNLNNTTANKANWYKAGTSALEVMTTPADVVNFKVSATDPTEINPDLKYTSAAIDGVMGVNSSEQNLITLNTKKPEYYSSVTFTKFHPVDGTTYYSATDGTVAPPVYNSAEKLHSFSPDNGYVYEGSPTVNGIPYYTLKETGSGVAGSTLSDVAKATKRWYKLDGAGKFVKDGDPSGSTTYWSEDQLTPTLAMTGYPAKDPSDATITYYTLNPSQGYFMVIPAPLSGSDKDLEVTVTIDYYVTTADPNLAGGNSNVHNVISQNVKLTDFTNGKAYLLKLILGLTSVKVEAEVSNWEVGTVESNLPQNLE